ncbi:hypothetical protein [Xanthomarina gelatinilytica]|uniref:hypothetical protein n=1 Tax=Xanthomarina gelatinilytica TaxID=1137281 RepID=UPI003AA82741
MKVYLRSIAKQLNNFSLSLDKTSILIDKPWALIDEEFEMQKLIFKKNRELILSKNGKVQEGKWDYFPEAKSLLIDRNTDKILCNEAFVDKGIMILKLDGTENRFFILANENIVPDLDANRYLKELRYQKLKIKEAELIDGRIIEVQRENEYSDPQLGNPVTVEAENIEDGKYQLAKKEKYYEIRKGRIFKILTEVQYTNPDGKEIFIQQQDSWRIKNGDYVYMNGRPVETAILNFTKSKNMVVRHGKVVRLERKNPFTRWISKAWKQMWDYYNE